MNKGRLYLGRENFIIFREKNRQTSNQLSMIFFLRNDFFLTTPGNLAGDQALCYKLESFG